MADLNKALRDSAAGPSQMTVDGQTTVEHLLRDQLAVTRYAAATRARTLKPHAGVLFTKLRPHGAAGSC